MGTIRHSSTARTRVGLSAMVGLVLVLAGACITPTAPAATPVTVYNNLPAATPGNVASLGFQATSTSEFGDEIVLSGGARRLDTVTFTLSDWAVATDNANALFCANNPGRCVGDAWTHALTLKVYNVNHSNPLVPSPGPLVGSVTQTFNIPFRPAADPTCPNPTNWRQQPSGNCFSGYAFNVTFDATSSHIILPDNAIVTLSFNTQSYGAVPTGVDGPYTSLNVGIEGSAPPLTGTDADADQVFVSSTWAGLYTDGGASGTGVLRQDTAWAPYAPMIKVTAH